MNKEERFEYLSYWMWGILMIVGPIGAFTIGLGYVWNRDYNSQYLPATCTVNGYRTTYFLTPRYKCYEGYVSFNVTDYPNSEIKAIYNDCYTEDYVIARMTKLFPSGKALECHKNVNHNEIRLSLYDPFPSLVVGIIFLSLTGICLLYLLIYYVVVLLRKLSNRNYIDGKN